MIVGVHCTLPAYIEIEIENGQADILHQGLGNMITVTEIERPYISPDNRKRIPPQIREAVAEIVENDEYRGQSVEWPGWNWG